MARFHFALSRPARLALTYVLVSIAWILLTNAILRMLRLPTGDRSMVEDMKGTVFVLVSGFGIYLLLRYLQNTAARAKANEYLATHDPLTRLQNRVIWKTLVQESINLMQTSHQATVMLVDIDHLRDVNSGMGNRVGDFVLRRVANTLERCLGSGDILCRSGHSEFAVFLPEEPGQENILALAEKILAEFRPPLHVGHDSFRIVLSIGISTFPDDGGEPDTLLVAATMALREAKKRGGRQYFLYKGELTADQVMAFRLESQLHDAISEKQFLLHYQPIFALPGLEMAAAEALVRWQHPKYGLIPPSQFIAAAERADLIDQIGDIVLRCACRSALMFAKTAGRDITFAVNLSAIQLDKPLLFKHVNDVLIETGCPPQLLTLEITESAAMREPEQIIRTLTALREVGIRIAIDDFGTGYSSLAYLRRLPINELKIDRSFIMELDKGGESFAIVKAIVALGHSLGMEVVAEGVETESQLRKLAELECDRIQGFLLGRPVEYAELTEQWERTPKRLSRSGRDQIKQEIG